MTPDHFAAFDAWLDEVAPPRPAERAVGDLYGRLTEAGERFEAVAAIHPHLVRLVSSDAVLLAVAGEPDPTTVEVLAIERAEADAGRRLVVRAVQRRSEAIEPGTPAKMVYQVGRQLFALECRVRGGGLERLELEYPRALVFFPGRAFPRIPTSLGGRARLRVADGTETDVAVVDASYGGVGLRVSAGVPVALGAGVHLLLDWEGVAVEVEAEVVNAAPPTAGQQRLGLRFRSTQPLVMRIVADLVGG